LNSLPDNHGGVHFHPTVDVERNVDERRSRAPWWHTDIVVMSSISVEAKTLDIL
jgi:hypothetical protein